MITTAEVAHELEAIIDLYLIALEHKLRLDIAATGPEDEDALDRPPDPDAPWRRITVEEIVLIERAALRQWRERFLATVQVANEAQTCGRAAASAELGVG